MSYNDEPGQASIPWTPIMVLIILFLGMVVLSMWGCPRYNVYHARMKGEAELQQAEQNRQIAVKEAEAKKDAAKSLADAEVIRAQGVAKANQIIGSSLRGNEIYLHYLWLQTLEQTKGETIYIPTEANFPLMEAGRLSTPSK